MIRRFFRFFCVHDYLRERDASGTLYLQCVKCAHRQALLTTDVVKSGSQHQPKPVKGVPICVVKSNKRIPFPDRVSQR